MVVALLAFIVGWFFLWSLGLDDAEVKDMSNGAALLTFALVVLPPLWAGALVTHIVGGRDG